MAVQCLSPSKYNDLESKLYPRINPSWEKTGHSKPSAISQIPTEDEVGGSHIMDRMVMMLEILKKPACRQNNEIEHDHGSWGWYEPPS